MQDLTPSYFKNILNAPSEHDLLELFEESKLNLDGICCIAWLAEGPINPKFVLTAIASHNERSEWHGQKIAGIDPEWQLDLEEIGPLRKKIWGGLKTSDLTLVLSLIPHLDEIPQGPPPQPVSKIGLPFPDDALEKWSGSLLQRSMSTRVASAAENQFQPQRPAIERGMKLSGNIKDVNVFDVLQSINFCKMTGRLNASDVDRFLELYVSEGELVHARVAHALLKEGGQLEGEEALLDLFCWEEGTFNFQPGWTTDDRSMSRGLQGLLMEGAMLKDYRTFLKKQNLTRKSRLAIAPDKVQISEAEFDNMLQEGLDVHLDLQKKIFLELRTAQQLEQIIRKYDLNNLVWIPVFFNLLNLKLIAILPA